MAGPGKSASDVAARDDAHLRSLGIKPELADTVDEGAVKSALALARHMKEQLSDREQTSGRLELAGPPVIPRADARLSSTR